MSARPLTVVVVHYRSGGMITTLFDDLARQDHPDFSTVVVECGADGSVFSALPALAGRSVDVIDAGGNLGYCGGNNLGFTRRTPGSDVLVINPDVRLPKPSVLGSLHTALAENPQVGAVGPAIRRPDGLLEHADSRIDRRRGVAEHTRIALAEWPAELSPELHRVPWLDGCCWLIRGTALDAIGGFDERFFLYCEEVDWCERAVAAGWQLGIVPGAEVVHRRSSSFQDTQKGAYYYWRNNYLLFRKHAGSRAWTAWWLRRVIRFALQREHLRGGASRNAVWGAFDALRGRYGPRPGRDNA